MHLGIDASNIRDGGGMTHLVQLLRAAEPSTCGFERVTVWAAGNTLEALAPRSWLSKCRESALEGNFLTRALWQRRRLGQLLRENSCDLLFAPGGTFVTKFRPVVTMSRNLLPFEWQEMSRYRGSTIGLRLLLLRHVQSRSFRSASGVIFLTEHARGAVTKVTGLLRGSAQTIPHGLDPCFYQPHRPPRDIREYSPDNPFRIIYVSIIDLYKHQWHVAEAVARLRAAGCPVSLTLVGASNPAALRRLNATLSKQDPKAEYLHVVGHVPHKDLPREYARADLCVFASSCENMPNILLEAMASGLAIACSNRGPMPEVLGEGGLYFDPESPDEIAGVLKQFIASPELRQKHSAVAVMRARQYSWERCARETFGFLRNVAAGR